jgi:hypothetical protein
VSDAVKITRPFCIFIQPDPDETSTGMWLAHVVGHELDNMTFGQAGPNAPLEAAYMAFDLLCCLANVSPREVIDSLDEADEVQP